MCHFSIRLILFSSVSLFLLIISSCQKDSSNTMHQTTKQSLQIPKKQSRRIEGNLNFAINSQASSKSNRGYIAQFHLHYTNKSDKKSFWIINSIGIRFKGGPIVKRYYRNSLRKLCSSLQIKNEQSISGKIPVPLMSGAPIEVVIFGNEVKESNTTTMTYKNGKTSKRINGSSFAQSFPINVQTLKKYKNSNQTITGTVVKAEYLKKQQAYLQMAKTKSEKDWKNHSRQKKKKLKSELKRKTLLNQ